MRVRQLVLLLVMLVSLTGCMSMRFKTTLPATPHDVARWADTRFYLAEVDRSGLRQKAMIKEQSPALELATLRDALVSTYPQLFVNDPRAVPLRVVIAGEEDDNSPLGPMLTGFTLGVIPFPDRNSLEASVRVEVLLAGGEALPGPVQTSFETSRVMYMSLVGPLGVFPVLGPSDAPRRAMFFFIPLTAGVYRNDYPTRELALKAVVESVMRGVDSLGAEAVTAARQARQRQMRAVDLDGRRLHLVTSYGLSPVGERQVETAFINVYDQAPGSDAAPLAKVVVATRESGVWTLQRGMLHLGERDYLVSAMMEKGVPTVPAAQRTQLELEDLVITPANLEGVRWSNSRLLALKNERWPEQVRAMTPEMVVERITRLEGVIMENSAAVERANDAAQDAIGRGADPREHREWAIILRQRMEILKAMLAPLKAR